MPAPYPLLDMPPGELTNTFDYQAITMAAAHNTFIQGVNAAVAHAPHVPSQKIQAFVVFNLTLLALIHHHHHLEETYYFPVMEEKLGHGVLAGNVDEHKLFVPKIEEAERWLKDVQDGKEEYDGKIFMDKFHSFADGMVEHLNHEIPTLESSIMRTAFTEKELKEIDKEFVKRALDGIDFHTVLPLMLTCRDPANQWFPPIPLPLKWAVRWWFSRRYSESWEFGTFDLAGNPRELPAPISSSMSQA